jgi:hypothetical protein
MCYRLLTLLVVWLLVFFFFFFVFLFYFLALLLSGCGAIETNNAWPPQGETPQWQWYLSDEHSEKVLILVQGLLFVQVEAQDQIFEEDQAGLTDSLTHRFTGILAAGSPYQG